MYKATENSPKILEGEKLGFEFTPDTVLVDFTEKEISTSQRAQKRHLKVYTVRRKSRVKQLLV